MIKKIFFSILLCSCFFPVQSQADYYTFDAHREVAVDLALNLAEHKLQQQPIVQPEPVVEQIVIVPAVAAPASALETDAEPAVSSDEQPEIVEAKPKAPEFEGHMGIESFSYVYREQNFGVWNHGVMYGVSGSGAWRPKDLEDEILNFAKIEGMFAFGHVNYRGSGIEKDIDDNYFDIKGVLGKDYYLGNWHLMPYAGFGFRRLFDGGEGGLTSTGFGGYNRESKYFYMPFGLDARLDLHNSWVINPILEYDLLLRGQQISYLDSFGYGTVTNNQSNGYGLRLSMRISKNTKYLNYFIEPFYRYWHIGASSINNGFLEPENTTREIGSKLGLQF